MAINMANAHPEDLDDSPAVRAAVALERRFGGIDQQLALILQSTQGTEGQLAGLKKQVEIANGRTAKNEAMIAENAAAIRSLSELVRGDRGLAYRVDELEDGLTAVVKHGTFSDGVEAGKVTLRTSDKWLFGTLIVLAIATAQIAVALLAN